MHISQYQICVVPSIFSFWSGSLQSLSRCIMLSRHWDFVFCFSSCHISYASYSINFLMGWGGKFNRSSPFHTQNLSIINDFLCYTLMWIIVQMATQEASPATAPSAQVVGHAFVEQYYHILHQSPNLVHRFYQESSFLSRSDSNGVMSTVTTTKVSPPGYACKIQLCWL